MIFFITRKRLKSLLRRAYNRGWDDGLASGYRLGWGYRTVDNQNRDLATPRVLREIDEIAKDAGL